MSIEKTFHRRNLPPPAVSFSSAEGKALFNNSLQTGFMEGYFRLAEHFITQGHPAFCGIGSLTMSLNSLLLDPKRVWQGVWRWFDESMLSCCEPLDVVKLNGITLAKLGCLAKCNGARTIIKYGSNITVEDFRKDIILVTSLPDGVDHTIMIVSYNRTTLKQSGSGHFSPVGGYCPTSDMVLIMDVARFKYPPHWVPLAQLHEALQAIDPATGRSRGYMMLSAGEMQLDLCECSKLCDKVPVELDVGALSQLSSKARNAMSATKIVSGTNSCDSREPAVNGEVMGCCRKAIVEEEGVAPVSAMVITSEVSPIEIQTNTAPSHPALLHVDADLSFENKEVSLLIESSLTTTTSGEGEEESLLTNMMDRSSSPSSMHIVDDGMQCTFNPDSSGSRSNGGVMYSPQEILHLFLNHTCKYCEKQQQQSSGDYVKTTPFMAVIE